MPQLKLIFGTVNIILAVEAVHVANLLCQFGYYFPVSEQKNLLVKDDSSLYRFQVSKELLGLINSTIGWPFTHRDELQ